MLGKEVDLFFTLCFRFKVILPISLLRLVRFPDMSLLAGIIYYDTCFH